VKYQKNKILIVILKILIQMISRTI